MDDNRFDDIIKGKLGEFEDASFDPSALAALHHRMASQTDLPWHVRYRSELTAAVAGSIVILFILWGQWYFTGLRTRKLEGELSRIQVQNEKLDDLLLELRNSKSNSADTIRIIEFRERDSYLYARLEQQIAELKKILSDSLSKVYASNSLEVVPYSTAAHDQEMLRRLLDKPFTPFLIKGIDLVKVDSFTQVTPNVDQTSKNLSAKEIIKKENYRKGIGFRLGPTLEVSQGYYRAGNGEINISYGILCDFILSPSLSFETGAKYTHRFYSVSETELSKINLEASNQNIGDVKLAEIDSWILEVPLNVKYRFPLSMKTSFLTRFGYSPMIYTGQTIEYSYEYDPANNLFVKDSHKLNGFHLYPGALNISLGMSRQLKNKKIVEAGLFYQLGLSKMGVEKNKQNFLGARAVYWFPLR